LKALSIQTIKAGFIDHVELKAAAHDRPMIVSVAYLVAYRMQPFSAISPLESFRNPKTSDFELGPVPQRRTVLAAASRSWPAIAM